MPHGKTSFEKKNLEDLHKLTLTIVINLLQKSSLVIRLGKLLSNYNLYLVCVRLKLSMSRLILGISLFHTFYQVYRNYWAGRSQ